MKIRKFNGSSWVQEYPEVRHTDIVTTGTNNSSTYLAGDGSWKAPLYYVVGNTSGTAGTWTGTIPGLTAYYDGLTIRYKQGIAGATNVYLNINSIGAAQVYRMAGNRLTTHWPTGTISTLTYNSSDNRWYANGDYNSTDDYRIRWQNDVAIGAYIHGYQLLAEGTDGAFYPVTEGGSTGNTNTVSTADLRIGGTLLAYESGTDIAAGGTSSGYEVYEGINSSAMEYWNNRDSGWATDMAAIYLVGIDNGDGSYNLDNSSYTSFLTQTIPTSDDGKIYIHIGWMNNTNDNWRLEVVNQVYVYKDGAFQLYSGYATYAENANKLDGINSTQFLRSDTSDTFTGNLALVGELRLNDTNTKILEGSNNTIKIQTNSGYTQIGPENSSWTHFRTDRARFYFGTGIDVDGDIRAYSNNTTKIEESTGHIYELGNRVLTEADDNIFDTYRKDTIDSASEDFNDFTTSGTYAVNQWNATGDVVANGPSNTSAGDAYPWGMLRVTNYQSSTGTGSGYIVQEYIPHAGDVMFMRFQWNGTWTNWRNYWGNENDGSGSNLDADLLDGVQGSSYLRSDADDNYNGILSLGSTSTIKLPNSAQYGIRSSDGYRVMDSVDATLRIGDTGKHSLITLHGQDGDDFRVYYGATHYNIWHQGNDGSGSGLDADTLDGVQGSSFVRSDANDTMTGKLTASGGINGLTLANGGIAGSNFNITGVNQLEFNDPGEGIVFKSGSSGDITLAIIDDSFDSILNLSGTNAALQVNGTSVSLSGHSHSASNITSGEFNTARLGSGTATSGYVLKSDGDGTASWGEASGGGGVTSIKNFAGPYVNTNGFTAKQLPLSKTLSTGDRIGLSVIVGTTTNYGTRTQQTVWLEVGTSSHGLLFAYYDNSTSTMRLYSAEVYISSGNLYIDDAVAWTDGSFGHGGSSTSAIYVMDVLEYA